MSAPVKLRAALNAARRRRLLVVALVCMLLLAPLLPALLRWPDARQVMVAALLSVVALGLFLAIRSARRVDIHWLTRRLDARYPDLEDSSALLFADPQALTGLAALQRARLEARVAARELPDLRDPWPRVPLLSAAVLSGLFCLMAWYLPITGSEPLEPLAAPTAVPKPAMQAPAIRDVRVRIDPPDYTGLPEREADALDIEAPERSRISFSLALNDTATGAALVFIHGERVALSRHEGRWRGSVTLTRKALYRVQLADSSGTHETGLHRLGMIADQPPQILVTAPLRTLNLLEQGQEQWSLAFEARDDHGLGEAELTLTLAQGSGETIAVSERRLQLQGEGDARHRRYRQDLDLGALGFAQGDDLIVRVAVSDRREPQPQVTRSASFILRWPAEPMAELSGMDGLITRTMPAYFRSQRQVILDTEALIAERETLSSESWVQRSDAIGQDQRLLRMRYGQFLGEEFEGGDTSAHAIDDADAESADEPNAEDAGQPGGEPALPEGHTHDDGHDHGAAAAGFGNPVEVLETFGHTHDYAEATTLFDPQTRALLRGALQAMWAAEGELRVGDPVAALPHEYLALEQIKQVQQAGRIYLARVGLELPPVDESRRLSGEFRALADRIDPVPESVPEPTIPSRIYAELAASARGPDPELLETLSHWAKEQAADDLELALAIDRMRRDDHCAECAEGLRARLWAHLPATLAAPRLRARPDARGTHYLERIDTERAP